MPAMPTMPTMLALPATPMPGDAGQAAAKTAWDGGWLGLDRFVEERRRRDNLPGVALALAAGGEVVFSGAWGVRNLASGEPLTAEAALPVGSLTKLVTTVAALRLVERGRLDLDQPVRRWVPWFAVGQGAGGAAPGAAAAITLRQLLGHRSGLPRGPLDGGPRAAEERLRGVAAMPLAFPPGARHKYSNLGFALAAEALCRAAGRPWEELARELVLAPAGMAGSRLGATGPAGRGAVVGYQRDHYRTLVRPHDRLRAAAPLPAPRGAGDLAASALDMGRLIAGLLGGGLLESASLAALARAQEPAVPDAPVYGLALRVGRRLGRRCLHHDGGHFGFWSRLRLFPDQAVGGVILCNRCCAAPAADEILDLALAPLLGVRRPPGWMEAAQKELERCAGGYARPGETVEIALARECPDDGLLLRQDGVEIPLRRHGAGRFLQLSGPCSEHLLRFAADHGASWECTAGPRRWVRRESLWPLLWDGPAHPAPPAARERDLRLVGVYRNPDVGDVRVHLRRGRPLFSFYYGEEVRLAALGGRRYRPAGGMLDGEPVVFELPRGGGPATALEAGYMRFERRDARPEDLLEPMVG